MLLNQYNSRSDLYNFNCGGFAFGSLNWYIPESYEQGQTQEKMLEECTRDILRDFPDLVRVAHPGAVPKRFDVIGFRLAWFPDKTCYYPHGEVDDLHFILRHGGKWFHKPGCDPVDKMNRKTALKMPWPRWNNNDYDSDIVWFARGLRK